MANEVAVERVKILWLVKGLGPGGAEQLLLVHAKTGQHDRFQYEIAYALAHKDQLVPAIQDAGVPVRRLPSRSIAWLLAIRRLVMCRGYDVVHVHSPLMAAFARLALQTVPASRRPRLVTTEHNGWASFRPLTRVANGITFPLNDHAFAVSETVLRSVWGPLRRRVELLVHGVLLDEIEEQGSARASKRAELGLAPDDVLILTVANMRQQKAYPDLLTAAQTVTRISPRAVFAAVGQGPLLEDVRRQRDEMGLHDRFHLLGHRSDIGALLAAADVFVLASRWEGFPLAVMEALAAGLPVVSTSVGGLPGAIRHGVDGLLVPPGQPDKLAAALSHLVRDEKSRSAMAAAARTRGELFDARRAVRRLDEVYGQLAGAGGRSRLVP